MKKVLVLFNLFLIIVSCSGLEDAGKVLRNEKTKTTDEFLVKKRGPLILPPDFDKIPEPGSINDEKDEDDKEKIQKILKVQEDKKGDSKSSSIENEILNKIRK